jgi:hypothetical protein
MVGEPVGTFDGREVGRGVGSNKGTAEGTGDGGRVGSEDGSGNGLRVGTCAEKAESRMRKECENKGQEMFHTREPMMYAPGTSTVRTRIRIRVYLCRL